MKVITIILTKIKYKIIIKELKHAKYAKLKMLIQ